MLANDAGLDHDADGFTALEEALAGTSPRDSLSRLDLGLLVGTDGIPVMKLNTVLYKRYQVVGSNNLTDWQAVGEPIEGDGAQRSLQDPNPAGSSRYYRLRVLEDRDRDGDGISDWEEAGFYDTSVTTPDSDADGIGDGEEALAGTNPKDNLSSPQMRTAQWTALWWYGQSWAAGADGVPVANTTAAYGHQTFANGPAFPTGVALTSASALYERGIETPCTSMARGITERRTAAGQADRVIFSASAGRGGYALAGLLPGTESYDFLKSYHPAGASLAQAAGRSFATSAVCWLQGESDAAGTTTENTYLTGLRTLADAIHADMGGAALLTYQTCAYTGSNPGPALAQLAADGTNHVYFVGPSYFLTPVAGSNIHPSPESYQEIGHRFSRAWTALATGARVPRIRIASVQQQGASKVVAQFTMPTAPLAINTARVPSTTDYGFRLEDNAGTVPLTSVTVGTDRVTFQTTRTISGSLTVRYGLDYNTTGWINAAAGNLCDSTTDGALIGGRTLAMPHWCPAFSQIATVVPDPPSEPETEASAWEMWNLQTDVTSLTGLLNERPLTPVDSVQYTNSSVICPANLAGYVNGLTSGFTDRRGYTLAMAIKRPADLAGYTLLSGTLKIVNEDGAGLALFSGNEGQINLTQPGGSLPMLWNAAGVAVGDWTWVCIRDDAGILAGRIGTGAVVTGRAPRTPSASLIGVGNCYVAYSNCANAIELGEVVLWDRALSDSELTGAAMRAKARMALKGINLVGVN